MQRPTGFTLIELMVTVAVVAILAGVALPSYTSYIVRGKITEATSNLLAMRTKMEQYFQDNRMYVSPGGGVLAPCAPGSSVPLPVLPHFNVTCPTLTATTYVIRADGGVDALGKVIDKSLVGLRLEINEGNQRFTEPYRRAGPYPARTWRLFRNSAGSPRTTGTAENARSTERVHPHRADDLAGGPGRADQSGRPGLRRMAAEPADPRRRRGNAQRPAGGAGGGGAPQHPGALPARFRLDLELRLGE